MNALKAWIILIGVPVLCVLVFFWLAPPRHNPFAPVDLTEPPGLGTWHQLTRAKKNRELCFTALDEAGVLYTPLEDQDMAGSCGQAEVPEEDAPKGAKRVSQSRGG